MEETNAWVLARISLIGLLPLLTVALSVFVLRNLFLAMFLMHWVGMAIPALVYLWWTGGPERVRWYIRFVRSQEFVGLLRSSMLLFILGSGFTIVGYILSSCKMAVWMACVGKVNEHIAEYGFHDAPMWLLVSAAIYFPVVNPLVEELFWRVFMLKELSGSQRGTDDIDPIHSEVDHLITTQSQDRIPEARGGKVAFCASWKIRLWISILYASYHTLVIGVFLGGLTYGILSLFLVSLLGLAFVHIFMVFPANESFYRAVFLHVGVDAGVVVALGDAIGWYNLI